MTLSSLGVDARLDSMTRQIKSEFSNYGPHRMKKKITRNLNHKLKKKNNY